MRDESNSTTKISRCHSRNNRTADERGIEVIVCPTIAFQHADRSDYSSMATDGRGRILGGETGGPLPFVEDIIRGHRRDPQSNSARAPIFPALARSCKAARCLIFILICLTCESQAGVILRCTGCMTGDAIGILFRTHWYGSSIRFFVVC
ncbi:hypothetical protein FA15DRAFT_408456 [Coprinopsis marcescibilis]|uniref:Uncharacterized protein n=1 Tax=Coprinopsis marcescibilis TaxID=230819 RepID=A0A5C3KVP7_COPMA|nr:hypothetical protein FA15DRAFT_408456 [Coprinopsis marcescibilis]